MTDHTERTTEPVLATEPRHTGTPGTTADRAPGTAPGRTPEAATVNTPADGKGLEPKLGGPGDLSVPPAPRTAPATARAERTGHHQAAGTDRPLVSQDDQDKLSLRMQHAVTDFVESPRRAVEEADSTFDQIVSGLTEALAERRRVLRASWQDQDTEAQTEELRVALQRYRDIGEQLLKI
ncbi:hypothetical protein ACFWFI_12810 [Streptomyces sp. NPDC060209]|uniref:hypothetical protein n=1 Tax=Streptomyces sp. NPDC060209 TaxID=3347073 RepID=UPI00366916C1